MCFIQNLRTYIDIIIYVYIFVGMYYEHRSGGSSRGLSKQHKAPYLVNP